MIKHCNPDYHGGMLCRSHYVGTEFDKVSACTRYGGIQICLLDLKPDVKRDWICVASSELERPPMDRKSKTRRNTDADLSKMTSDEAFAPDWDHECEVCGQKPVVAATGLCGPCTFGEADTADGNW